MKQRFQLRRFTSHVKIPVVDPGAVFKLVESGRLGRRFAASIVHASRRRKRIVLIDTLGIGR